MKRKLADDLVRITPNLGELERILGAIANAEIDEVNFEDVSRNVLRGALDRLWGEHAGEPTVLTLT